MAIKISGSTIIDDSSNIVNAGIITASAVYAEQFVGTGDKLIFSPTVTSFSPTDGATDVPTNTDIVLTFDQQLYLGGSKEVVNTIFLRNSSSTGTVIAEIPLTRSNVTDNTLGIYRAGGAGNAGYLSSNLPLGTNIYVVLPEGVIKNSLGVSNELLDTYNFTTTATPGPGDAGEGGYIICQASSVKWVVAPSSTEVSRNWYCRDDAVTTAQANAACGDWFVPTCAQLQNPGMVCRSFWDSYAPSNMTYWSSTESNADCAWSVLIGWNTVCSNTKPYLRCVRAFRCVSY